MGGGVGGKSSRCDGDGRDAHINMSGRDDAEWEMVDIQYWVFFPYHGAVHHYFLQSIQTFQGILYIVYRYNV